MDQQLFKFITAVKTVIYNADRASSLIGLMANVNGAVTAVNTVLSVIDKKKPIPPEIRPMLAVSTLMLLVDLAQEATGKKPSTKTLEAASARLMQGAA